ncbi:MAG: hypothetical protein CMH63_01045 [Nanoarchaeota archaeon]|nr:hypothetical protein [Nanoarchaeota archaeon]|tara:strand:+ start:10192 stop:10515 length:324 start_codon:yes stop_codon:yes gene_type:complete
MQKGVGISGLSSEKTYVQLKDGFRESLFDGAHNYFDNWRILGEFLGIKRGDTTIARNWKEGMNCYPLNIVLKIGNLINITKKEIEKNIIQIRYKTQIDGGGVLVEDQ